MQKIFLNALNQISVLGPKRIFSLLRTCKYDAQSVWQASYNILKQGGLNNNILNKFLSERKKINPPKEWERLKKLDIELIIHPEIEQATPKTILDYRTNAYPPLLSHIPIPPPFVYLRGQFNPQFNQRIAVVGSRKMTSYGKRVLDDLVHNLALNKLSIVSGLALGVDAYAHIVCMKANTPTIAVLANGLDEIYPKSNTYLADKILSSGGTIISEFPLGTPPLKYNFPQRNRIISGLAQATLIIEAALKSGSLITATHALEQNRDIFAIPGNIHNTNSQGTNNLIKQGAKLVTSAEDILFELNLQDSVKYVKTKKVLPSSPIQQKIYDNLSSDPIHIDQLLKKIKLSTQEVNSTLTLMEIKGVVKNIGGAQYIII